MLRTMILSVLGLVAIAGAPIVYFTASDFGKSIRQKWFAGSDSASADSGDLAALGNPSAQAQANGAAALAPEGPPTRDLAEVLRFDVTTGWITQRWPRVSAGLAQLKLQGYRVPLVTGTAETDLAGALTYYFDPQQQVQRITFHGTTGNARELVALLTGRHKFTRRLTNNPGMFVYEAVTPKHQPQGVLKITSAPIIESAKPHRRFSVDLVMNRPS